MEVGKIYNFSHTRKGNFTGKVIAKTNEWCDIEITAGEAGALCEYNIGVVGDTITVRTSFLTVKD